MMIVVGISFVYWHYEQRGVGVKSWYNNFKFALASALVFVSGYLVAKPRNEADKVFAPVVGALCVYYLWRSRKPRDPFQLN